MTKLRAGLVGLLLSTCVLPGWIESAEAQTANVSDLPPAYTSGSRALSQTQTGGLRTQLQDGNGNDVDSTHPLHVDATLAPVTDQALNPLVSTASPAYIDASHHEPSMTLNGAIRIVGCGTDGNCISSVTSTSAVGGDVANDAADAGNPVKIGCVAENSTTNVTAGDRTDVSCTLGGEIRTTTSVTVNTDTPITPAAATATKGTLLGGQYNSTQATFTNGQQGSLQVSSRGELKTNICDAAANARCANVDASNQVLVNNSGQTQPTTLLAGTTGGCTMGKTLSAASTNATSVKGSAGTLCTLAVINTTATIYYLKWYDKATAATCNSDTVLQSLPVPASATGAGYAIPLGPYGWNFPTGITFCLTGALADNDNTNAATGVAINYSYK